MHGRTTSSPLYNHAKVAHLLAMTKHRFPAPVQPKPHSSHVLICCAIVFHLQASTEIARACAIGFL